MKLGDSLNKETKGNKNKRGLTRRFFAIMVCVLSIVLMPGTSLCVQAEGAGDVYDLDWLGGAGNDTFDELTTTVKETGNSMYKLVMAVGVVGVLLSVIICGLLIAVGTNANKRSEHIGHLVMIMVGGILIFGAVSIIGMLQTIGGNIG